MVVVTLCFVVGVILFGEEGERRYKPKEEASVGCVERVVGGWMRGRFEELSMEGDTGGVCAALLFGDKGMLSEELLRSYRRGGAAHLLAVSGLHIGILTAILMGLCSWMALFYGGDRARRVFVVAVVWIYAMGIGATASTMRAVVFFTIYLLSYLLRRRVRRMDGLWITIFVMLCLEPQVIYDVGFQYSVVSVMAILLWVVPLWHSRGVVDAVLYLPLLIGAACTVATLPISAYYFGYFSLWGVLLNPLVMATTTILLMLLAVWMVLGIGLSGIEALATPFRWVLERVTSIQSGAVEYVAREGGAVEVEISGVSVALIYLAYLILTYVVWRNFVWKR